MSFVKHVLSYCAVGISFALAPVLVAQESESDHVYLEELGKEPPASIIRHQKAQSKYEDGQLRLEREVALLSDDTVVNDGAYIEYYPDGQKFCEGKYDNGVITGEWQYWHPNGQLRKTVIFENAKPNGKIEMFRPDGTLEAVQSFKNGVRNGEWSIYYDDGKTPQFKTNFTDGKLDGERITFYSDGTVKQKSVFAAGLLDGLVEEFDESGKKVGEATFEKGQRKSFETFD